MVFNEIKINYILVLAFLRKRYYLTGGKRSLSFVFSFHPWISVGVSVRVCCSFVVFVLYLEGGLLLLTKFSISKSFHAHF